MKIGQIARETGVSRDTIRLYENMGLLKDVSRPHPYNNYKEYPEENIKRVQSVLMLKKLGLSLNECKEVLQMLDRGDFDIEDRNAMIQRKIDGIDKQIEELTRAREMLVAHMESSCSPENRPLHNAVVSAKSGV